MQHNPMLYRVPYHMPSIGARAGQYLIDNQDGTLTVLHEAPSSDLAAEDRAALEQVRARPQRRLAS